MSDDYLLLQRTLELTPMAFDAAFTIIALASAIAALTKTPRDDVFWGRAYSIVDILALNFGYAKQSPPNRTGGRFSPD